MIVWLLGLSGSGKTTLGEKLRVYIETFNEKVYMIDGDEVRQFFGHDLGYTIKERKENMKRILYAANALSKSRIFTIICNISPWNDIRDFSRRKVHGYHEIFLKRSIESCIENDVKGIYAKNMGKTELIGIDIEFETPEKPDLILDTDAETVEESFHKLIEYIHKNTDRLPSINTTFSVGENP